MYFVPFIPPNEETKKPKRKPLVVQRAKGQQDVKRIARATTYMQIPSSLFVHASHVTMDVKLYTSLKCGPRETNMNKNLQAFSHGRMSFEANPDVMRNQSYNFSLGELFSSDYLSKQFPQLNLRKKHVWVSFGGSSTLYILYCQIGKTSEIVNNMLEVEELSSGGLTVARESTVNLNTISKHKLHPTISWDK